MGPIYGIFEVNVKECQEIAILTMISYFIMNAYLTKIGLD
jgi:hypothetical protein